MKIRILIVICHIFVTTNQDDISRSLEKWVRDEFIKGIKVDVTTSLTKLRYTQFDQTDYMSLLGNCSEIAIEVQPFLRSKIIMEKEKVSTSPVAIYENRLKAHQDFISMCGYFRDILEVKLEAYKEYNGTLGKLNQVQYINDSNFRVFIHYRNMGAISSPDQKTPITSPNIKNIRLFVSAHYAIRYYSTLTNSVIVSAKFSGYRMGYCRYNQEVLDRLEKVHRSFNTIVSTSKVKDKAKQTEHSFEYMLSFLAATREFFIYFDFVNNEANKADKLELYTFQTNLALSKALLRDFKNVGYHNKDDDCYFDFGFSKTNGNNFRDYKAFSVQYIKKLLVFNLAKYKRIYPNIQEIRKECSRVKNVVLNVNTFGGRRPQYDIKKGRSSLLAFEKDSMIRYIYVYSEENGFGSESIYKFAQQYLGNVSCQYHDDDYMVDAELNEMYLITFIKDNRTTNTSTNKSTHVNKQNQIANQSKTTTHNSAARRGKTPLGEKQRNKFVGPYDRKAVAGKPHIDPYTQNNDSGNKVSTVRKKHFDVNQFNVNNFNDSSEFIPRVYRYNGCYQLTKFSKLRVISYPLGKSPTYNGEEEQSDEVEDYEEEINSADYIGSEDEEEYTEHEEHDENQHHYKPLNDRSLGTRKTDLVI